MPLPTVDVAVCTRPCHREPLCLDCAAAVGGKRYRLPKRFKGLPCPSCVDMARDRDAETLHAELEEATLDTEAERQWAPQ